MKIIFTFHPVKVFKPRDPIILLSYSNHGKKNKRNVPECTCFVTSFDHWRTIVKRSCLLYNINVKAWLEFFFEHVIVTGSATWKAKDTLKKEEEKE